MVQTRAQQQQFNTSSESTIDQRPSREGSTESELVTYDSGNEESDSVDQDVREKKGKPRTTRQKRDWRPKSTFWQKPMKDMTLTEKLCHLATLDSQIHELKDESFDRGPVPTKSVIPENIFILAVAFVPLIAQSLSYHFYPDYRWPMKVAYPVYLLSFIGMALAVVARLEAACLKYGTFDEKQIGRDRTPDQDTFGLAKGITAYMVIRTAAPFYYHYKNHASPAFDITWSFPVRIMIWQVVFDYFFYVYHRATHEVDALWFVHQKHHTTKHPTAILAILAGDYQEVLELFICPWAAAAVVPMTFSELYITLCYTIYVEMMGHSGVRAYWPHPTLWWLKAFDAELAVEDHDLHHRFGKSGRNYGKQTRVWDRIFGTTTERIETYGM